VHNTCLYYRKGIKGATRPLLITELKNTSQAATTTSSIVLLLPTNGFITAF